MYQKLAQDYDNRYKQEAYNKYAEFVLSIAGDNILDLACGTGSLIKEMKKNKPEINIMGCDKSEEMLEVAKNKNPSVVFKLGNMTNFNLSKSFSVIACTFDSINHLLAKQKIKKLFNQVKKHLEPNGYFIFDFNICGKKPKAGFVIGNFWLIKIKNEWYIERFYNLKTIIKIAKECGFIKINRINTFNFFNDSHREVLVLKS